MRASPGPALCPAWACLRQSRPQNEARRIQKEAEDLDRLLDQKLQDYEDLRDDMRAKELEVQTLLEKGRTEQQVGGAGRGS